MTVERYAPSSKDKFPAVNYGAVESTLPPREATPWLFERPTFLQNGYMYVVEHTASCNLHSIAI